MAKMGLGILLFFRRREVLRSAVPFHSEQPDWQECGPMHRVQDVVRER